MLSNQRRRQSLSRCHHEYDVYTCISHVFANLFTLGDVALNRTDSLVIIGVKYKDTSYMAMSFLPMGKSGQGLGITELCLFLIYPNSCDVKHALNLIYCLVIWGAGATAKSGT